MLAFVLEEGLLLETSDEGLLLDTSDEGLLLDTPDVDDLVPARVDRHCSVLSDYETDSLVIIVVDTSDEGLLLDTPDVDDLMPALVVEGGIVLDINVYRFLCT
jgi:hypothetical protein